MLWPEFHSAWCFATLYILIKEILVSQKSEIKYDFPNKYGHISNLIQYRDSDKKRITILIKLWGLC